MIVIKQVLGTYRTGIGRTHALCLMHSNRKQFAVNLQQSLSRVKGLLHFNQYNEGDSYHQIRGQHLSPWPQNRQYNKIMLILLILFSISMI